ncbi:MAG: hypothetical protein KDB25_04740 [Leucobacter sp.]|nr:hypothetical protein [Leucobacter sp.]
MTETTEAEPPSEPDEATAASSAGGHVDGLVSRIAVIEAQPLDQRAAGFDQLAEELLTELQRADHEGAR